MAFSKAQTQAIMHKDGPMMVLAGPGVRENNGDHPSGPVSDEGVRNQSGGYSCDSLPGQQPRRCGSGMKH